MMHLVSARIAYFEYPDAWSAVFVFRNYSVSYKVEMDLAGADASLDELRRLALDEAMKREVQSA